MSGETRGKSGAAKALERWGAFLGIAALCLLVVILPYIVRGKYLLFSDGITQHATFLEYMFRNGLFRGAGGYDYAIGLGADYMTSFAYYMMFDPVNLLLYILPRSDFLLSYSIVICVRYLLTAVSMYVYLRRHGVRQTLSVIFAVAYMLSGYALFTYVRHPDLSCGAMWLPLLTLGLEKAIDRNRPFLLIGTLFFTVLGSFYMAYMVTLFAVLYAVLYFVQSEKARAGKVTGKRFAAVFFRTAGYYAVGLLLASFVLVPVAYGYFTATRSAGKGLSFYSFKDLVSFAGSFFIPAAGSKYTPVLFNIVTLALAFAACAAGRNAVFRRMTIILSVGVFVPLFGYTMNLFNYANNRFTYMLSFCAFALIALHLNEQKAALPDGRAASAICKGCVTALAVLAHLGIWTGIAAILEKVHAAVGAMLATLAVLALIATAFGLYAFYRKNPNGDKLCALLSYKRLTAAFIAVTFCGAVVFTAVYSRTFDDGSAYAALSSPAEQYVAARQNDGFVRLDRPTTGSWSLDAQNRPLNSGYRGTQSYNTVSPDSTNEFLSANGVATFIPTLGMAGLNSRPALQALLGVKWYAAAEGGYVPHGFTPVSAENLYETDDYVRFGSVFGQTMSQEQWLSLACVERQYAMLGAVVTQSGENTEYVPLAREHETAYTMPNPLTVDVGETAELPVSDTAGKELYVAFTLAERVKENTVLTVSCGAVSMYVDLYKRGHQMYSGQTEYLYKLDGAGDAVRITCASGEAVNLGDVRLYTVTESEVTERIRTAAALPHLQDVVFSPRGFSGTIESDGGVMFIPLSHSTGWRACVDGQFVAVQKANGGLMCIDVGAGTHTVEFIYRTPWLTAGVALSACAAVAVAGLIIAFAIVFCVRSKKAKEKPCE